MLPTLVRQAVKATPREIPANIQRLMHMHPLKKVWPPKFAKLSPQEQLRFEKKYKRRLALATARPRWIKFTQLAQMFCITGVVVYAVLFMDWGNENQPFYEFREALWGFFGLKYQRPVPKEKVEKRPLHDAS